MDNLKNLEQLIEQQIDPNGAPGSILAINHQNILKQVLATVGKFTGSAFTARKNATVFPAGTFSWNGNAMNNPSNFVIRTSKNTADLNDFGLVLGTMAQGDIIRFKDYVGRSVMLTYISHEPGVDGDGNPTWDITVEGFATNPNYIYQETETAIAVLSVNKTIGITKPYVDQQDEIFLQLAKDYTDAMVNANKQPFIESKSLNWDGVGLTFEPTGKWWFPQTSATAFQKTETITLDPAEPVGSGLDRIDGIVFDNTGDIVVVKGTPSADPVEPTVNPDTQIQAWFILVQAGATTPSGITKSTIYNENTQTAGGEWNTSENTSGARINLASTADVYSGTVAIELTDAQQYDEIIFTPEIPIAIGDIPEIGLVAKNKVAGTNANPVAVQLFGNKKNGSETFQYLPTLESAGFDPASLDWQKLGMEVNQNSPMLNVTRIRIVSLSGAPLGMFIDLVTFSGGTVEPPVSGSTEISIQDENGVEQFKATDAIQFSGVDFIPGSKRIKVQRKLKEIVVQDKSQLTGTLDSSVVYMLDGVFTLGTGEFINVPAGGVTLTGYGFDVSQINKNVAGQSIFKSETGGSGNVILKDTQFASGAGSVFNITDVDGEHAIEFNDINFVGCASLGTISGYRQFTGTTCGIYGCSDGLMLDGAWNGFKLTNTNAFGFGSAGTMFKKGSNLTFSGRFYVEMNIDFPAGAKLSDFNSANFLDKELFQINSTIAKVDGVLDDNHANTLVPNIKANNEKCLWRSNVGLPDSALEKFVNDDDIAGTYNIDWLKDTYFLTMTADTTFTESNLPANLKNTEEIKIYLQGNFTPTFVSAWNTNKVGTFKPGEINQITLKFIKTGVYFMKIDNSLTVYPAPDLKTVEPSAMLPNTTGEVILNGSFFTPASIVQIQGQTVNSIEFVNSGQLKLSVTTPLTEGDFDITISNGTSVTFDNVFAVASGVVYRPTTAEFINVTGTATFGDPVGQAHINNYNTDSMATWNRTIPLGKNWSLSFSHKKSPLGNIGGNGGIHNFALWYKNLGTEKAYGWVQGDSHCIQISIPTVVRSYRFSIGAIDTIKEEYRCIDGKLYLYRDDQLKGTDVGTVDDDLELRLRIRQTDLINIKYVEYFDI